LLQRSAVALRSCERFGYDLLALAPLLDQRLLTSTGFGERLMRLSHLTLDLLASSALALRFGQCFLQSRAYVVCLPEELRLATLERFPGFVQAGLQIQVRFFSELALLRLERQTRIFS
jgi:hypothetical protein